MQYNNNHEDDKDSETSSVNTEGYNDQFSDLVSFGEELDIPYWTSKDIPFPDNETEDVTEITFQIGRYKKLHELKFNKPITEAKAVYHVLVYLNEPADIAYFRSLKGETLWDDEKEFLDRSPITRGRLRASDRFIYYGFDRLSTSHVMLKASL
jgi:hypothetical protein